MSIFGPFSATNPAKVVQVPGVYYYMAAKALEKQWNLVIEHQLTVNIDLSAAVIDLYTKAYEQFRDNKAIRMTLYLASEIARVYKQSGKYDMV